jgi:hypothetical protein
MSAAAFASYDGSPRNARLSTASLTQSSWHNHTQHHVYCALCRALLSFQGACCTVYYAFIHVLLRSCHAWAKSRITTFRHLSSETVGWWYRQPTVPLSRTENSMDDRLLMLAFSISKISIDCCAYRKHMTRHLYLPPL